MEKGNGGKYAVFPFPILRITRENRKTTFPFHILSLENMKYESSRFFHFPVVKNILEKN